MTEIWIQLFIKIYSSDKKNNFRWNKVWSREQVSWNSCYQIENMDYKLSTETDQLRWGITASAKGECWGARGARRVLTLHQVHAHFCCTVICYMFSIYVIYLKHLTVALISQLTGMNITSLKIIWVQGVVFSFYSNFSVRSIQPVLQPKEEAPHH